MKTPKEIIAGAFSTKRYLGRDQKAADILKALDSAGYVITPKYVKTNYPIIILRDGELDYRGMKHPPDSE